MKIILESLLACTNRRWSPAIGDPTVMGWVTVFAYVLAAILCVLVLSRSRASGNFVFWLILSGLLALQAINKQLDIQSAATAFGRCVAQAQGWYEDRRAVQFWAIIGVICLMSLACVFILVKMRHTLDSTWLAILGICFLSAKAYPFRSGRPTC